jgi:DNA end-binding protein Ku
MAHHPSWRGHLRLSLVTCPVTLHKATDEGRSVHFHLLNPATMHRVHQTWRDGDEELSRGDLVRGYEVEKGEYVVVSDEELEGLQLESTRIIDIERFVDASTIDRLYWDTPYYVVPSEDAGMRAFAVIRDAMAEEGQVAIGRLVMQERERIVAIEPRGKGLLLTTLRSHDEVRSEEDLFAELPRVRTDAALMQLARKLVTQSEGAFDPEDFHDRYADALHALVEAKAGRREAPEPAEPEPESNVIDLMEALRRSLRVTGREERPAAKKGAARKAPAARKTPTKRSPARKAS